ncbi:MAG: hypothetical protein M5U34_33365 [Chloroflexi bacterium]|nr:hypothetical protein [Chloroflexota bacterium]
MPRPFSLPPHQPYAIWLESALLLLITPLLLFPGSFPLLTAVSLSLSFSSCFSAYSLATAPFYL